MKRLYTTALISIIFILSGCSAIYNWFDSVGQHFPVAGERCENWQCFTASGQEASREKIQQQQAGAAAQNKAATTPNGAPAVQGTAIGASQSPDGDDVMLQQSPVQTTREASKNY